MPRSSTKMIDPVHLLFFQHLLIFLNCWSRVEIVGGLYEYLDDELASLFSDKLRPILFYGDFPSFKMFSRYCVLEVSILTYFDKDSNSWRSSFNSVLSVAMDVRYRWLPSTNTCFLSFSCFRAIWPTSSINHYCQRMQLRKIVDYHRLDQILVVCWYHLRSRILSQ